ncbi:hypothetical protein Scep_015443 [Stephania cephalantha]|uniref:Uncharacterized protein n=1 Tax=Stephania cephalantha TaxID=152367 RepID=A0AAP0J2V5_9MAGN
MADDDQHLDFYEEEEEEEVEEELFVEDDDQTEEEEDYGEDNYVPPRRTSSRNVARRVVFTEQEEEQEGEGEAPIRQSNTVEEEEEEDVERRRRGGEARGSSSPTARGPSDGGAEREECPQCGRKCKEKDIIKLYVSRISVADSDQQKIADLNEKIDRKRVERMSRPEVDIVPLEVEQRPQSATWVADPLGQTQHGIDELVVDGARVFDMDADGKILILARRLPGMGGTHLLTKNGMVLVFDMRQTAGPLESISGLTCRPVHTIHSLAHYPCLPSGVKTILTASAIGPCVWKTGYNRRTGQGVRGSHVAIKRVNDGCYQKLGSTSANVNDVRMSKSAIVTLGNCNPLFAYGDETTHGLCLFGGAIIKGYSEFEAA